MALMNFIINSIVTVSDCNRILVQLNFNNVLASSKIFSRETFILQEVLLNRKFIYFTEYIPKAKS